METNDITVTVSERVFSNGDSHQDISAGPERFITLKTTTDADLQLVRDLCENRLKRDPNRRPLSRIRVEPKRGPVRLGSYNDFKQTRTNYDGKKFVHFTSGSEIEVVSRNAFGKLIIKWADGNMIPISEREFEATFSRKP